jgi:hypothetical protein
MRLASEHDTGRTLALTGQPLALCCERCRRRSLLTFEQLEVHGNDRRRLVRLPLVCRCGSAKIERYLLESAKEAAAFLVGNSALKATG